MGGNKIMTQLMLYPHEFNDSRTKGEKGRMLSET
jgi:hypothetical protein